LENIQPHDWFFKQIFSNPLSIKTVLNIFAPKLASKIEASSLKLVNTEKFSEKSQKFMLDLLFSCKIGNDDVFIRLVFEHKSYIDNTLPSQLMYYNAVIWEETAKETNSYPPIINIVFYHGKRKWNIPTTLPVLKDKQLEDFVQKLNYILIDLNEIQDDDLIRNIYKDVCTISALLVMKHIFDDLEIIKNILKLLYENNASCIFLVIDYVVIVKKDLEKVEEILKEISGGEEKMMTLTEKWKMEGWMVGKAEGKMEGKMEGKKEALIKLIQLKFGVAAENLEKVIYECKDLEELDKILTKVALANSIEEINIK